MQTDDRVDTLLRLGLASLHSFLWVIENHAYVTQCTTSTIMVIIVFAMLLCAFWCNCRANGSINGKTLGSVNGRSNDRANG